MRWSKWSNIQRPSIFEARKKNTHKHTNKLQDSKLVLLYIVVAASSALFFYRTKTVTQRVSTGTGRDITFTNTSTTAPQSLFEHAQVSAADRQPLAWIPNPNLCFGRLELSAWVKAATHTHQRF